MNRTIPAIFDGGVFRPLEPVDLPDGTRAEVAALAQIGPTSVDTVEQSSTWPPGYFEHTAGALAGEKFDRPSQGDLPQRTNW